MKTFKTLIILISATIFLSVGAQEVNSKKGKVVKTIEIKTSSQCNMCKERIEKEMVFTKGVKSAVLNVETKILTVKYNEKKTNPDKIRKAVSEIGYDADDIPAETESYHKLPKCCRKGGHE